MSTNIDSAKLKKPTTGTTGGASAPKAAKPAQKNISAFGKLTTSGKAGSGSVFQGDKGGAQSPKGGTSVPKGFGSLTTGTKATTATNEGLKTRLANQTKDVNSVFGQYSAPVSTTSQDIGHNHDGQMSDRDFKDRGGHQTKGHEDNYGKLNRMHDRGEMPQGGHDVRGSQGGHGIHGSDGHYADHGGAGRGGDKGTSIFGHGHGGNDRCGDNFHHGKFNKGNGVISAYTRYKTGHAGSDFYNQVNSDFKDVMSLDFDDVYSGSSCGSSSSSSGCSGSSGSSGSSGCSGSSGTKVVYVNSGSGNNYGNYGTRRSSSCGCSGSGNAFMNALNTIGTFATYTLGGAAIGKALGNMMGGGSSSGTSLSGLGSILQLSGATGSESSKGKSGSMAGTTLLSGLGGMVKQVGTGTPNITKTVDVGSVQSNTSKTISQLNNANESNYKEALEAGDAQYVNNEGSIAIQNNAVSEANKNVGSIQGDISTNTQGLADTQANMKQLNSWCDSANDTLTKQEALRGNLTKQKEDYKSKADTANGNIESYKKEASEQGKEVTKQEGVISDKKARISSLKQQIAAEKAKDDATADIPHQELEDLERQLKTAEDELAAAEKAKKAAEDAKAKAEQNQGKAQTEFDKYSKMTTQAETDIKESQSITEDIEKNKKVTDETQKKLDAQEAKFEQREKTLKESLEGNRKSLSAAQNRAASLTADRDKLVCEQNKLRERMNEVNRTYNKTGNSLAGATDKNGNYVVGSASAAKGKTLTSTITGNSYGANAKTGTGTATITKDSDPNPVITGGNSNPAGGASGTGNNEIKDLPKASIEQSGKKIYMDNNGGLLEGQFRDENGKTVTLKNGEIQDDTQGLKKAIWKPTNALSGSGYYATEDGKPAEGECLINGNEKVTLKGGQKVKTQEPEMEYEHYKDGCC